MSAEVFKLFDGSKFNKSIVKRGFIETYHKQNDQVYETDKNKEFTFGEKNYYQRGISYLQFYMELKKDCGDFDNANTVVIRLVINALAHVFKEPYMHTTGGKEIEGKKCVGEVSTLLRLLTSRRWRLVFTL